MKTKTNIKKPLPEPVTCSGCSKVIATYDEEEDEVKEETIFIIERSKNTFEFNCDDNCIEISDVRNTKMQHYFCEECFLKICTGEKNKPTDKGTPIGQSLYHKQHDMFIW